MYDSSWRDELYSEMYYDDSLMHYGVPGMRWGHRKSSYSSGGSGRKSGSNHSRNLKRAAAIAGAAALAGGAAYMYSKRNKNSGGSSEPGTALAVVNKGGSLATRNAPSGGSISKSNRKNRSSSSSESGTNRQRNESSKSGSTRKSLPFGATKNSYKALGSGSDRKALPAGSNQSSNSSDDRRKRLAKAALKGAAVGALAGGAAAAATRAAKKRKQNNKGMKSGGQKDKSAKYLRKADRVAARANSRQAVIDRWGNNKLTRQLSGTDAQRYWKTYDQDREKYYRAKASGDKAGAKKYGKSSRKKLAKGLTIQPNLLGAYDRYRSRGDSKGKAIAKTVTGGSWWN